MAIVDRHIFENHSLGTEPWRDAARARRRHRRRSSRKHRSRRLRTSSSVRSARPASIDASTPLARIHFAAFFTISLCTADEACVANDQPSRCDASAEFDVRGRRAALTWTRRSAFVVADDDRPFGGRPGVDRVSTTSPPDTDRCSLRRRDDAVTEANGASCTRPGARCIRDVHAIGGDRGLTRRAPAPRLRHVRDRQACVLCCLNLRDRGARDPMRDIASVDSSPNAAAEASGTTRVVDRHGRLRHADAVSAPQRVRIDRSATSRRRWGSRRH